MIPINYKTSDYLPKNVLSDNHNFNKIMCSFNACISHASSFEKEVIDHSPFLNSHNLWPSWKPCKRSDKRQWVQSQRRGQLHLQHRLFVARCIQSPVSHERTVEQPSSCVQGYEPFKKHDFTVYQMLSGNLSFVENLSGDAGSNTVLLCEKLLSEAV